MKEIVQLQKDLDQLDKWSKDWLLKFHPQKCKYMKMGKDNVTGCMSAYMSTGN